MTSFTFPVSYFGKTLQNEILTALAPADIPANLVSYEWQSSADGVIWSTIASATANTFMLTQAQVGSQIRVLITTASSSNTAVQNVNDLPVGTLEITGTTTSGAAEGDKLVATTARLSDLDGLGTFHYQWQSRAANTTEFTDLAGATTTQLILAQTDVGNAIRVKVSYTDGGGTLETVYSSATGSVANINNAPSGSVKVALQSDAANTAPAVAASSETLLASNTLADVDGLGQVTYQWQKQVKNGSGNINWVDLALANGDTLSVSTLAGQTVRVLASYTDGYGTHESQASTAVLINDPATGTISIAGALTQDQTLTASNNLQDVNGVGVVSYSWYQSDTGLTNWTAISGTTGNTLLLAQSQVGKAIRVDAVFTDGAGNRETVSSSVSTKVANVDDVTTGTLTLSGNVTDGSTLTAVTSGLTDVDGLGKFDYQWQVLNGVQWQNLDDKTSASLTLTQSNVGQSLRLKAVHTDLGGYTATLFSAASTVTNTNNAPSGAVTLDGTAKQGELLRANTATLADLDGLGTLQYSWQSQAASGPWTTIPEATSSTLALTAELANKKIHVIVSYTDVFGTGESVTSAASIPFKAAGWTNAAPVGSVDVAGFNMVAATLKASNTLTDADGISTSVGYHWQVSNDGRTEWKDIQGANKDSLVLATPQQGKYVRAVADYTDDFGTHEVVYSTASALIAFANTAPKFAKTQVFANIYENTSFVSLANAVDADPGDKLIYTVTGTNANLFQVVNGSLQFINAPDFESAASKAADNHYKVDLVATDSFGATTKQMVYINVLNINERPYWIESARTVFVKDGSKLVDAGLYSHLIDPDKTLNLPYTYTSATALTIGGADSALFYSNVPGKLSFTSAAISGQALSDQGKQTYQLELVATDRGGLSTGTQYLTVQTVNKLGTSTNDVLVGTTGNDRFAGMAGDDSYTGGAGADTFFVSQGKDTVTDLGNGADILIVSAGAEAKASVVANWTATADTINLGLAKLTARASVDLSAVNSGNGFTIEGAAANLTLAGSHGADTFVLTQGKLVTVAGFETGKDIISFKGLSNIALGAVASNTFAAGTGLTEATTAEQRLLLNTTTGDLYFDADGSGSAAPVLLVHFSVIALPTWADMRVELVV